MSLSLKSGLLPEQSWGVFWHILIKMHLISSPLGGEDNGEGDETGGPPSP
jgi:hypothetical protein